MYTHRDSGAHSHLNTKIPKLSESTLEHKRHGIYPEMPRAQAFHIASSQPPVPSPEFPPLHTVAAEFLLPPHTTSSEAGPKQTLMLIRKAGRQEEGKSSVY